MALIPVFIGFQILLTDGHENQKILSREKWHLNCYLSANIMARVAARDDVDLYAAGSVGRTLECVGALV
jgi:hypothetical protein